MIFNSCKNKVNYKIIIATPAIPTTTTTATKQIIVLVIIMILVVINSFKNFKYMFYKWIFSFACKYCNNARDCPRGKPSQCKRVTYHSIASSCQSCHWISK